MATTRGRLVQINQVILDQADFFEGDGYTRKTGLVPATDPDYPQSNEVVGVLYYNNILQSWPMVDGGSTTDAQVAAGSVYWHEVSGSPGIYNVRFRPNAVGYWRLLVSWESGTQILAQDFDVSQYPLTDSGLRASFTRPNC